MARPKKVGIDYFPMSVDLFEDDKVSMIDALHGIVGCGFITRLMCQIYQHKGYYYEWGERQQIAFAHKVKVDHAKAVEIVNDAIKWGFFNQEMFEKYQILTSKGFQERYLFATGRRVGAEIKKEYLLVELKEVEKTEKVVNDDNKLVSANINSVNDGNMSTESTQKKLKEIKDKKIKDIMSENQKEVFDHWNEKGIIKHREFTAAMKGQINARLEAYSMDELKQAIDNYAEVYSNANYWFSYKWTLQDFMNPKNVMRFTDDAEPFKNFAAGNKKGTQAKKQSVDIEALKAGLDLSE